MGAFYSDNRLLAIPFAAVCLMQLFWFILRGKPEQGEIGHTKWTDLLVCICVTFTLGTLLYQYPGTKVQTSTDSSVFLYIGKQMHAGKTPYVDLFDHKGPALYVIQYLGFLIWPDSFAGGVWILEMLSDGLTAWLMLKLAALVAKDYRSKYLALMMVMITCGFKIFMGGNYTEEHALPWITLSAYIFFRFFSTGNYSRWQILLLGFSCMVVALLQGNLITSWLAFTPIVVIVLLRQKKFRNVLQCILDFAAGMLLALAPVLVWAYHDHFLEAMWETYIKFNFAYSDSMAPGFRGYVRLTLDTLSRMWPGIAAAVIAIMVDRKNKLQWLNLWFLVVSILLIQMSGRTSPYYRIVLLPALVLPFTGFFDWLWRLYGKDGRACRNDAIIIMTCLLLASAAGVHRYRSNRNTVTNDAVVQYLKENTTEEDSILIIGNYVWPYLAAQRTAANRYFFQWPPINVSDELYQDFLQELKRHPSDVIILPEEANSRLAIPEEGKIEGALLKLEQMNYQPQQYDGFRVYLAPEGR